MEPIINNKFTILYHKVREKNPSIVALDNDLISEFDLIVNNNDDNRKTLMFVILLSLLAPALFVSSIIFLQSEELTRLVSIFVMKLCIWINSFNTSLTRQLLLIFIITNLYFVYFYPYPMFSARYLINKIINRRSKYKTITKPKVNNALLTYQLYAIITSYICVLGILILLQTNHNWRLITSNIITQYISITLELIMIVFVLIVNSIFIIWPIISSTKLLRKNQPTGDTAIQLMLLLDTISSVKNIHTISQKQKRRLIYNINYISDLIQFYPKSLRNESLQESYVRASFRFRCLQDSLIMPKKDSLQYLQVEIVNFCNCFLSGNLDALPREEQVIAHYQNSKWKNIASIILLFFLLLIPIVILTIVENMFHLVFSDLTQYLFMMIYIVWSVIVITSSSTTLTVDTKEYIIGIIQYVRNKN